MRLICIYNKLLHIGIKGSKTADLNPKNIKHSIISVPIRIITILSHIQ